MNAIEPSLELRLAISDYHHAVDNLAGLGQVERDRFGYGMEDFRNREAAVIRAKERMEALSARDYHQAGN